MSVFTRSRYFSKVSKYRIELLHSVLMIITAIINIIYFLSILLHHARFQYLFIKELWHSERLHFTFLCQGLCFLEDDFWFRNDRIWCESSAQISFTGFLIDFIKNQSIRWSHERIVTDIVRLWKKYPRRTYRGALGILSECNFKWNRWSTRREGSGKNYRISGGVTTINF